MEALQRTAAPLGSWTVRVICQRLLQPTGRFRRRSLSLVVRRHSHLTHMELHELAHRVDSKETFLEFVAALLADWEHSVPHRRVDAV